MSADETKTDIKTLLENFKAFVSTCTSVNKAYIAKHFELVEVFATLTSLNERFQAMNNIVSDRYREIIGVIRTAKQNISPAKLREYEISQGEMLYNNISFLMQMRRSTIQVAGKDARKDCMNPPNYNDLIANSFIALPAAFLDNYVDDNRVFLPDMIKYSDYCLNNNNDDATKNKVAELLSNESSYENIVDFKTLESEIDFSALPKVFLHLYTNGAIVDTSPITNQNDEASRPSLRKQLAIYRMIMMISYTRNPFIPILPENNKFTILKKVRDVNVSTALKLDEVSNQLSIVSSTYLRTPHMRLCIIIDYQNTQNTASLEEIVDLLRDKYFTSARNIDESTGTRQNNFKGIKSYYIGDNGNGKIIFELPVHYNILNCFGDLIAIPHQSSLEYDLETICTNLISTISDLLSNTYNKSLVSLAENKIQFALFTFDDKDKSEVLNDDPEANYVTDYPGNFVLIPNFKYFLFDDKIFEAPQDGANKEAQEQSSLADLQSQIGKLKSATTQISVEAAKISKSNIFLNAMNHNVLSEEIQFNFNNMIWYFFIFKLICFGLFIEKDSSLGNTKNAFTGQNVLPPAVTKELSEISNVVNSPNNINTQKLDATIEKIHELLIIANDAQSKISA